MSQPANGVTISDRRSTVNILNNILRQYYSYQPDYLLNRARRYEAMCFKRAVDKQQYCNLVNEGICKIAKTYEKIIASRAAAEGKDATNMNPVNSAASQLGQSPEQGNPNVSTQPHLNTAVPNNPIPPANASPSVPIPQPSSAHIPQTTPTACVTDFLLSLGITPSTQCPGIPNPSINLPNTVTIPTSSLAQSIPPPPPAAQGVPPNASKSPSQAKAPKQSKSPRMKTSTEASRRQRAKKRNCAKAGLKTPTPQKAPPARQESQQKDIKTEVVAQESVSTGLDTALHIPDVSASSQLNQPVGQGPPLPCANFQSSLAQQINTQQPNYSQDPSQQECIYLTDDIRVSFAQVYIAAASIGYRLPVETIKRLSREQVIRLFLRARQVALAKAGAIVPGAGGHSNAASQQIYHQGVTLQNSNQQGTSPQGDTAQYVTQQGGQGLLFSSNGKENPTDAVPVHLNNPNGMVAANTSTSEQRVQSNHRNFYDISLQGLPSQYVPQQTVADGSLKAQGIGAQIGPTEAMQAHTEIANLHVSAALSMRNRSPASRGQTNSGGIEAAPTAGNPRVTAPNVSSFDLTHQNGTGLLQPASFSQPPIDLITYRLQRFQQKYRVYLKLVQDNLTAMLGKGNDEEQSIRYMRYSVRLLTCSTSDASRLSMELIDRVESFLREYLVRYQGIAMQRGVSINPVIPAPDSSWAVSTQPGHAPSIPAQLPSGSSLGPVQQAAPQGVNSSTLAQQSETSHPKTSQPAGPTSATPPPNLPFPNSEGLTTAFQASLSIGANNGNGIDQNEKANVAIRAIESQREAIAAAGVRHAQAASSSRILTGGFEAQNASLPPSGQNLQQSKSEPNGAQPQTTSVVEATPPLDLHSQIAKRVSRVNHYVRLAVHATDCYKKGLEQESMLRVKEERIAEVTLVLKPKKQDDKEEQEGTETEKVPEPSLMEIIARECEEAQKKHKKLIIQIKEECQLPVVTCLLGFQSIRLPKMVVHVPGAYKKERWVTFGFQRPPLGWIGVLEEIRNKFYSIHDGNEGVKGLLEAWATAAEEILRDG